MFELTDKKALVTGATGGIGGAIARAMHAQGAIVTVSGRQEDKLKALVAELGERAHYVVCDLANKEQVAGLVDAAVKAMGGIDILVNNAGTNPYFGPIVEADEAAWDKTMDVNLKGPFLLSKLCARRTSVQGGGSIINVASIAGTRPSPKRASTFRSSSRPTNSIGKLACGRRCASTPRAR